MATLAAHRNGDTRTCGATTVVTQQSTVFVNNQLWAIDQDPNSHGNGQLNAALAKQVYIGGTLVCLDTEDASPDNLCPIPGGPHCDPDATSGSPDVFTGLA